MHCPFCNYNDTKVIDSRLVSGGVQVRRRRQCVQCLERFTTFEAAELLMPKLIKRDGTRVPFDEQKLRSGIVRALEKRPVPVEEVEKMMGVILHDIQTLGEREVSSREVGEIVLQNLRDLDQVAFVRFASVYRSFKEVKDFTTQINELKEE
jgi:transcriptional repressor NrdR